MSQSAITASGNTVWTTVLTHGSATSTSVFESRSANTT